MMISLMYRLLVAAFGLVVFWPIAFYLERAQLFDVLNGLVVAVGLGIMVTYSKVALRVFRNRTCSPAHLLLLAITLSWMAVILRISIIWIWRHLDRPQEYSEHVLMAFPLWIFILAGALHLTAHNATDECIPKRNLITLAAALVTGIMLGAGVALSSYS